MRSHPPEETQWAINVINKIKQSGLNITRGASEKFNLTSEFKRKFGRSMTVDALNSWLVRANCKIEKNGKSRLRFSPVIKRYHTQEETQWIEDVFNKKFATTGTQISRVAIKEMHLQEEYHHKFGHEMTVDALYQWIRNRAGLIPKKSPKRDMNSDLPYSVNDLLAPDANCLLIVDGHPIVFPSEESVKKGLEEITAMPQRVKLFVTVPVSIKYKAPVVSIGEEISVRS